MSHKKFRARYGPQPLVCGITEVKSRVVRAECHGIAGRQPDRSRDAGMGCIAAVVKARLRTNYSVDLLVIGLDLPDGAVPGPELLPAGCQPQARGAANIIRPHVLVNLIVWLAHPNLAWHGDCSSVCNRTLVYATRAAAIACCVLHPLQGSCQLGLNLRAGDKQVAVGSEKQPGRVVQGCTCSISCVSCVTLCAGASVCHHRVVGV